MSHPYAGNPSYPVNITIPDDGDLDAAVAYAVALEQLADRTKALAGGGVGGDFTDATFHGTTTFADGAIAGTVTSVNVSAAVDFTIAAGADMTIGATDALALSGNAIDVASTTTVAVACASLNVRSGQFSVASGAIQVGTGSDVITVTGSNLALGNTDLSGGASCNVSLGGIVVFASTSNVEAAGSLYVSGTLRLLTQNRTNADFTVNGTTGYEHMLIDNPSAGRTVTINNTGAGIGQRLRLNAQKVVTGAEDWTVAYGARTWFMRNAAAKTVILEFVYDGSGWVVDDWEEGGNAGRNG